MSKVKEKYDLCQEDSADYVLQILLPSGVCLKQYQRTAGCALMQLFAFRNHNPAFHPKMLSVKLIKEIIDQ
jgi:hypothetical protein